MDQQVTLCCPFREHKKTNSLVLEMLAHLSFCCMMASFSSALLVIKKTAFFGILSYRWRSLIYPPQTTQPINM